MSFLSSLHRIKVLGRELQVKSTATPERVREIEEFLVCKVDEIEASSRSKDPMVLAILTLLNVAELFLEISSVQEEVNKSNAARISRLLHYIEEAVG